MKRTAFLQALVLVALLIVSWLLLLGRLRQEVSPADGEQAGDPVVGPEGANVADATEPAALVNPSSIEKWAEYLRASVPGSERWERIGQLRQYWSALPPLEASAILQNWLATGPDMPTGVRMRVGPGGEILGAASLSAVLLDGLAQLDPKAAAAMARHQLALGTAGQWPDTWVMHLRNLARTQDPEDSALVRAAFIEMTRRDDWIRSPQPAVAEAMDVAVFLGDPGLVPELASLTTSRAHPVMRHAASLALERLVDASPEDAAEALLSSPGGMAMDVALRASLMARLDPSTTETNSLLTAYLAADTTRASEVNAFLGIFPNLNLSLSHNLLSGEHDLVTTVDATERLRLAWLAVQAWRANPLLASHAAVLQETEARLLFQLTGRPAS